MKKTICVIMCLLALLLPAAFADEASAEEPKKMCALTFDDGPHKSYTPRILDVLDEYGVKATFFLVGTRISSHEDAVRRIVESGHEIGCHTWNHESMRTQNRDNQLKWLARWKEDLYKALGYEYPVKLLRSPGGGEDRNTVSVTKEFGCSLILWSVDTRDWDHQNPYTVCRFVRQKVKDGSIILMHDLYGATAEALPGVIEYLQGEGYELVTVSELLRRNGEEPVPGEIYRYMPAA